MDLVLWAVGVIAGALVLIAAAGVVIGRSLPQDHVAARTVAFRRTPEEVWSAINDPAVMDPRGQGMGSFAEVESVPPKLLVRKVVGDRDFGGTWTCEIAATADGSTLTITERGYVYNPFFRFVSRYVIGHYRSIDGVMAALRERFGEA
ncbi:MAG TPA: hypothetical protein VJQ09_08445 [Candidatus Limnocylindria bacterium]|nr:hypothetical protein [Candidatus Limnocylindria bacterium]